MSTTEPSETLEIRPLREAERPWLVRHLIRVWLGREMVSRGKVHDAGALPALVCERRGRIVAVATFEIVGDECELVTLDAIMEGVGAGSALLRAVADAGRAAGCRRMWVITTNDNLVAQGFYRHRGMTVAAVHEGTLDQARELKRSIPLVGSSGIGLRDEVEFELAL